VTERLYNKDSACTFLFSYLSVKSLINTTLKPLVTAEDADIGANQVIAYQLAANVSEEVHSKFKIDSTSGWISTVNLLDREQMGRYEFNVIASDNGFPRRSSLANVVIDVGDINDNPPVFTQTRYFATGRLGS